jgi:superfamily II DNA or RNA helicase/HKD family nuclease
MQEEKISLIRSGLETAYINGNVASELSYKPNFVSNNYNEGKKVLSVIEDELLKCDKFQISVAFITLGGVTPLLQTLKELEKKGIPGEILTSDYLDFSEPLALKKLHSLSNVKIKMYDTKAANNGFHTKGYIFKEKEIYHIIIGSSNMTSAALTTNREWNTKLVSTFQGEMAEDILQEFDELWNSKYAYEYDTFYEEYKQRYDIIKTQKRIAQEENVTSLERYRLKPNSMQVRFIANLRKILQHNEQRALLISATGTGKTYASAFAMRELGFKRVLFLVHRATLATQAKNSYQRVFGNAVSMGLVGAGYHQYGKDYVFATVETLNKDAHLQKYKPDEFDCIILDEAHHSSANTYQKVMQYFRPRLFLGMTATPDKRTDNDANDNIYEIFHHQIAYEIRLQQAMEEDLLCPFHYFGITDLSVVQDTKAKNILEEEFNKLIRDERVKHIIEQSEYYGYSGDRVKGLIFCSRKQECKELSKKFNDLGYRTVALSGEDSEEVRQNAFERLAMEEGEQTDKTKPLDYIFSVDILNEGVDIVEVNQVIMLRPTQSPIVFIQQLGRGLRKANGKEYVVILDFIGNYNNNFMIPVALSGDRSYNADTIRKYVISGNRTIPGASTIHFDEVAKNKIFHSIDRIRGIKSIIRESYISLKNRLGRTPRLYDFYSNNEVDPLVIIREYKTYYGFLESMEKANYCCTLTEQEKLILEYLSKTILSGVRPEELEILQLLLRQNTISIETFQKLYQEKYRKNIMEDQVNCALEVLQGKFVSNEKEYQKYETIDMISCDQTSRITRVSKYGELLRNVEFRSQVEDIIKVGLARYHDKFMNTNEVVSPFVLYEKYSRRDVSLLMNCGKDLSSVMFGMKRIQDDVFIFVTYHKEKAEDERNYVDGKPDYADVFEDNMIFKWDSKIGMGMESTYMKDVITAPRKHLFVKKSDAESNFYYMGTFDIIDVKEARKEDNKGKLKPISKVVAKMHHPVRDDLLCYLQSNIE